MLSLTRVAVLAGLLVAISRAGDADARPKHLDLKAPLAWNAECSEPADGGLAFGGCDLTVPDGALRTRVRENGAWKPIHDELRAGNPLQRHADRARAASQRCKLAAARSRAVWFKGLSANQERARLQAEAEPLIADLLVELDALLAELAQAKLEAYETGQAGRAQSHIQAAQRLLKPLAKALAGGVESGHIQALSTAQISLEQASAALDCEPQARALSPIAYDAKLKLYVLFGGDHFDHLTADTWTFDPALRKWRQRHPATSPAPRANHQLSAADGKVTLSGGYDYTSQVGYVSAQYRNHGDGEWVYDLAANTWTASGAGKPGQSDARTYRTGLMHPDAYLAGGKPDAAAVEAKLATLPANTWVLPAPPHRPVLNRDWGTAVIDPDRDQMLRWSGGHSAHGGSDVPHYHFSTNRWELPFPVEFPLGQLYSNTSYPGTRNFNLRPWITGHTYLGYEYDPNARKMLFVGHHAWFDVYDPDAADWTVRAAKPPGMVYGGCFYDLNCTRTPAGIVCWGGNRRVHRYDAKQNQWLELPVQGRMPAAVVDHSVSLYDSRRDRLLMIQGLYGKPYSGQVWALDLKSLVVSELAPTNMAAVAAGPRFGIDRGVYDPGSDLIVLGTLLPPGTDGVQRTPAYDCAGNRWVSLKLNYSKKGDKPAVPIGHSAGLMHDAQRKLIWGVDTDSNIFVLRLDTASADLQPLP